MPADLSEQIPYIRRLLEAMRIPILEYEGFEADDVIGTIARRAEEAGVETVIVSSDKDMLQLVGPHISMLNPAKDDTWYDAPPPSSKFMGVPPERIPDLLALMGDSIDNIPGAPGIGEKGARDLISESTAHVEALLDRAGEITRKRPSREPAEQPRAASCMSKRLATIECAVPIAVRARCGEGAANPDFEALKSVYKELEFYSILREMGPGEDTRANAITARLESA